jgi:hypothetical protein
MRIAGYAHHDLTDVNAPEKLEILFLHMLKQILPEIRDGMRPGPAETIMVEVE